MSLCLYSILWLSLLSCIHAWLAPPPLSACRSSYRCLACAQRFASPLLAEARPERAESSSSRKSELWDEGVRDAFREIEAAAAAENDKWDGGLNDAMSEVEQNGYNTGGTNAVLNFFLGRHIQPKDVKRIWRKVTSQIDDRQNKGP
eukprot:16460-Heterococcus_DN1.PRE.2